MGVGAPRTHKCGSGFEQFAELPRWVEPLAWDGAGRLYHLWGDRATLWLGRSADRGATWERWPIARDDDRIFFPYLIAAGPGELAASWFTGRGERLAVRLARVLSSGRLAAATPIQDPERERFGFSLWLETAP